MKIGLFGGTFDPIHEGHIHVANVAISVGLDRVVFVPNYFSSLKIGKPFYPKERRLNMICEKIYKDKKYALDTFQIMSDEDCPSYTIDLVRKYKLRLSYADELYYIMGGDAFCELDEYKNWQEILYLSKLVVIPRSEKGKKEKNALKKKFAKFENRIYIINCKINTQSSTKMRKKLK